ncbi:heterokaryon incompatibility protein-domain-containing protein [Daldinia vernicosa]|uniref:heterokaryon incompatibility protein-domain-containing protein n=1 Tax=Daldinia vernicosa TaxID=114800 RepID=UPI002008E445|nr:heterokaryon incompatibility protein-domain-containing protein [Daldinia vernicosa]KAI0850103.1 heterokaryon incompatibility protein-domain-containing protein [Daldinia vernicosa]
MSSRPSQTLPFNYDLLPLDRSKKEIRLLKLKIENTIPDVINRLYGASIDEFESQFKNTLELERPIECEIMKASLEAPPEFYACSYVWGPSTMSRRLILRMSKDCPDALPNTTDPSERFEVEITDNLHLALAHYRGLYRGLYHDSPSILLWADAVCINQNDKDEKSWQVQMMREIYESAKSTWAWLGPVPERQHSQVADLIVTLLRLGVEALQRFGWEQCSFPLEYKVSWPGGSREYLNQELVEWIENNVHFHNNSDSEARDNETFEPTGDNLKGVAGILRLPFWRRVWILQEVVLSKTLWFYYGPYSIDSETLHGGLKLVAKARHLRGMDPSNYECSPMSSGSNLHNPRYWNIAHTDINEPSFCPMLDRRFPDESIEEPSWNYEIGCLQATMESDFIFGVLGLVNEHDTAELIPDYTKSHEEVHVEATTKWIHEMGLKVLSYCQNDPMPSKLPSWVPNFKIPGNSRWVRILDMQPDFTRTGLENPGPPRNFRFLDIPSSPTLLSMGREITVIKRPLIAMPVWEGNTPLLRRIWDLQGRLVFMKDIIEECATAYRTKENRHLAFVSTLTGGGVDHGRLLNPEDKWSLDQIIRGYKALIEPSSVSASFSGFCSRPMPSRFFTDVTLTACIQAAISCDEKFRESAPTLAQRFEMDHPSVFFIPFFNDLIDILNNFKFEDCSQMFEDITSFIDLLQVRTKGRKVLISEEGYLVLGPRLTEPGDIVAFLDGGRVPFILRPSPDGSFRLVGEAYMFGVMDREVGGRLTLLGAKTSPEAKATINQRGRDIRREFSIK